MIFFIPNIDNPNLMICATLPKGLRLASLLVSCGLWDYCFLAFITCVCACVRARVCVRARACVCVSCIIVLLVLALLWSWIGPHFLL